MTQSQGVLVDSDCPRRDRISAEKLRGADTSSVSSRTETVSAVSVNEPTETEQQHSAAARGDVTHLSRRALNSKNALLRIERKTDLTSETSSKTNPTSRSVTRDADVEARTVFVGNVALNVKKKVTSVVIDRSYNDGFVMRYNGSLCLLLTAKFKTKVLSRSCIPAFKKLSSNYLWFKTSILI